MTEEEAGLTEGSFYRGYRLYRCYEPEHKVYNGWRAFHPGDPTVSWFNGDSAQEVAEKIDAAYAELPVPVY